MRELEVTTAEAGQRLDRFLRKLLPEVPLGGIFKQLRRGAIRVDGRRAQPHLRLEPGMRLRLTDALAAAALTAPAQASQQPGSRVGPSPRIVHQDADLLVVDKPGGLAVQPGTGNDDSLVGWLDRQSFGVRTATFRPAPAHRLDRGTSGLVLVGLSPAAARGLAAAFREDRVEKTYLAVVLGTPAPERGVIDAPLLVKPTAHAGRPKVVVDTRGKPARSDYEVLQRGGGRALLRLRLHTGRTHQLRAHLSHRGWPIIGDQRYGAPAAPELPPRRFLLHAARLALPHPHGGEACVFEAEPPSSFVQALSLR